MRMSVWVVWGCNVRAHACTCVCVKNTGQYSLSHSSHLLYWGEFFTFHAHHTHHTGTPSGLKTNTSVSIVMTIGGIV
jgi:hypothetical protein